MGRTMPNRVFAAIFRCMMSQRIAITLLLMLAGMGSQVSAGENWPQFRGPGGQGICDVKNLPLTWSETQNVVWKTPIHGKAWSSPVIWKDQIWMTTATPDGTELGVVCVDKASGKILVDKVLFHIEHPQYCIAFNSYGSPTPCVEEGRVYVTFGSPGTACLDTRDASVIWTRTDFVCNHFRGAGSSPLLWNDLLIMDFDGSDFQFVVALDKRTGKNVWRTERSIDFQDLNADGKPKGEGDFRKAFSTPRITTWENKPYLVSLGSHAVYCYDPASGKEYWRTEYRDGHSSALTPVFGDNLAFTGTGAGATEIWALRLGGQGVINSTHVAWKFKKKAPTRPSPLYLDGLLYMTTDAGIVSCLDAKTGQDVWHGRIDGKYSASPIYAAGRIYFFSEEGKTAVLEARRELKQLAENALDDGIMATPAVSGDALFIRTKTALYRVENSGK